MTDRLKCWAWHESEGMCCRGDEECMCKTAPVRIVLEPAQIKFSTFETLGMTLVAFAVFLSVLSILRGMPH